MFPNNAPIGTPTVQSILDTLAWGGTVSMGTGWSYVVGEEDVRQSYGQFLRGTYALDTTATSVPEPASLLLLASGLALTRVGSALQSQRSRAHEWRSS
jgi:hypothetical protein